MGLILVAWLLAACRPIPTFTDHQGQPITLTEFQGKPLLINYFAPWCAPCLREMPRLNALAAEGDIAILAINYDPTTVADLAKLAQQYQIQIPLVLANDPASLPFPRPSGLPTSYLLDRKGELIDTFIGELDQPQITELKRKVHAMPD
nr:TlpA disulfide reductase family protein [Aeromonas cavernicola]